MQGLIHQIASGWGLLLLALEQASFDELVERVALVGCPFSIVDFSALSLVQVQGRHLSHHQQQGSHLQFDFHYNYK